MSPITAAAEPPEEPAGTRSRAQGLRTGPKYVEADDPPEANSCMLVFPISTAPACFNRTTTSASLSGTRSSKTALAAVVRVPSVSILSLSAIGMPCSGPRNLPAFASLSNVADCARASCRITVMNALILGLYIAIRSSNACVNFVEVTSPEWIRLDASLKVSAVSSSCAGASAALASLEVISACDAAAVITTNSRRFNSPIALSSICFVAGCADPQAKLNERPICEYHRIWVSNESSLTPQLTCFGEERTLLFEFWFKCFLPSLLLVRVIVWPPC